MILLGYRAEKSHQSLTIRTFYRIFHAVIEAFVPHLTHVGELSAPSSCYF